MQISEQSVVALAATGAPVEALIVFKDGFEAVSPVVAWATVVRHHDEQETDTIIVPVVIHDGGVWTQVDLEDNYSVAEVVLRPVLSSLSS